MGRTEKARAEMARTEAGRIEMGWFGRPVARHLRARLFRAGARALVAIERAFIKPTHRRGRDG